MEQPRLFVATKAFIVHDGKVLLLRESSTYDEGTNVGKYDVVGGRLTPGEHFRESLEREIKEETGLTVEVGSPFYVNEWRPTVKGEDWQIVGVFFECTPSSTDVVLGDDHDDFIWIDPTEYKDQPVVENLYQTFEAYLANKQ